MLPGPAPVQDNLLVRALARHGGAVAVVEGGVVLTYVELAQEVAAVAARLGSARRLVLLEGRSTTAWLTAYLGALHAGCPVLLVPPGPSGAAVAAAYDPDVHLRIAGGTVEVHEVRARAAAPLHEDLALLLSTSGSSGSPKLVRLSRRNLLTNAEAVAASLGVRSTDRAITTLPVHYCYGLSVVHSHLLRGAGLVLTERSVVEPAFWELFDQAGATTFAGVPYTFDLLDRVGFVDLHLPRLRCVTQAGGRLAPERVRRYAELGVERGWDLVVMYGQTEATARMAVLPPDLAAARPTAIGRPVPGGAFCLEPVDDRPGPVADGEVGELVYTGPNVMLGYATGRADLACGSELDRLRTGDLARRAPDGLWEVVGRRGRSTKLFGLRLDQEHVEDELRRRGLVACVEPTGDGRLGVVVETGRTGVREQAAALTGLPLHAVHVVEVPELPRRPSGKPDLTAVRTMLQPAAAPADGPRDVRALLSEVLGVDAGPDDTFVGLGGDSLSYVETTVRLEQLLGRVPADWHMRTVAELTSAAAPQRRRRATLDTTVALRALAILLVVASHADVIDVPGGAHLLLALAGYDLARFQLRTCRRSRPAAIGRSLRRLAVPAAVWTAGVAVVDGSYGWPNVLLLNHLLGPQEWGFTWNLWFLEALVLLVVGVVALVSLRPVDRWQRRQPFAFAMLLVAAGLLVRFGALPVDTGPRGHFTPQAVLWLFALGMAAAAAGTRARRTTVIAVAACGLLGWFGDLQRELVVLAGIALLVGVQRVPSTGLLTAAASTLASASLYVYVTHWQVYRRWEDDLPLLALAASLLVGLAYWRAATAVTALVRRARRPGVTAAVQAA
jgi:acyl-CoA synthetase (AMP-forming)/AMP-acid ligase II/peptidoglycan/LPS O-acetylase OafA/YrhL